MGFTDDSDNDLPDWLSDLGSDQGDEGIEYGEDSAFDPEEDKPEWITNDPSSGFELPEEDEEEVPDWLAGLREQHSTSTGPKTDADIFLSDDDDLDDQDWLENIRDQYVGEEGEGEISPEEELDIDFLDTIQALKAEDEQEEPPVSDDEPTVRLQDYFASPEEEMPAKEDTPDWISGLPSMGFGDRDADQPGEDEAQAEEEADTDWLRKIRDQEAAERGEPVEESPGEPESDIPEGRYPKEQPFSETPEVTGSLPAWMETLQTSGLVLPSEPDTDEELAGAGYSDEEISTLFEQDDLPDWLGSDSAPDTGPSAEPSAPSRTPEQEEDEKPIERAELPSWLQAIRPVEAVTSVAEDHLPDEQEALPSGEQERVGPLSGLRDVLPAEPHIIHFGTPPRAIPGFELTEIQRQHADLLKSMVGTESASAPTKRRTVANPQQILRWVIAILLLAFTFAAFWLSNSFTLMLPKPEGMPPENLAVISLVNELSAGDQVLLAVEYQPGLSGELEAASAALVQHLLLQDARIVLVSTQPTGPGLGDAFLQENFKGDDYISSRQYANLGYVSGGSAGLLNFASDIRQTKADMAWDQPPLSDLQTIQDFALVAVLTEDPDTARSWVEQVQPLLENPLTGQEVPMVMVVSAQAEPLVYPYYYTDPQQVAGLISGIGGGAYYETVTGPSIAQHFWTAYNVGLVLAMIIIAVGSIYNLTRNSLSGLSKGRS
ncbi:MAG: hypothetical protein JW757_12815 [Anaerolineales bacterium]|nr:hypothetical protein [Anaerolineales bacterium]